MNASIAGRLHGRRPFAARAFSVARALFASVAFAAIAALIAAPRVARAGDVLTQHYDTARTGATLEETQLTTSNVNATKFGKLFARPVNGSVYAQPLYAHALDMGSAGTRDVLFVATMHNSVYAFDADDPSESSPLWRVDLEPSSSLPDGNIGYACGTYKDISTEIGVIGTPVIDRARGVLYVVTFSRSGAAGSSAATYSHHLHALDLATGAERLGGPVTIAASTPGSGAGSSGGAIAFQSRFQNQRASLLLANDRVYVGFGAYCDTGPYHGWLLAYAASDLALLGAFNTTADGGEGGIWQAGQAPAIDADGNVYFLTGNGTTNVQSGGQSLATAFVKLSPDLALLDWFVPYNFASLNQGDADLGSSGVLVLPGTNAIVGGGKQGKLYLLDRASLGHYHAGSDAQILQSFQATFPPSGQSGHLHGAPVYWSGPQGATIYVWGENDYLRAFTYANGRFDTTPQATSTFRAGTGMPGGILAVSANGSAAGSGIVWSNMPLAANANQAVVTGVLRAFDASNVAVELWSTQRNAARDGFGNFGKFAPVTVANGRVYLATFSNQVVAYGLLPSTTALASSGSPSTFGGAVTFTATVTGPASGTPSGAITFADGGAVVATVPLDGSGAAAWTTTSLGAGAHVITAAYAGDASFNPSTSAAVTQTVARAPTATTLAAAPSAPTFGQPLTLTATVASSAGTPTGAVTFADGATTLGAAPLDGSGVATLTTASLDAGAHAIVATYAGDANFAASASASCGAPVAPAAPSVTLVALPDTAYVGASIDLYVTVAGVAGRDPTGVVALAADGASIGAVTLAGGKGALTIASLGVGAHALRATYAGDARYAAGEGGATVVVSKVATAIALTASPTEARANDDVWLDARLTATTGSLPSGVIGFYDGATRVASAAIDAAGRARTSTRALAVGQHAITATFAGDGSFAAATSAAIEVRIVDAESDGGASDADGGAVDGGAVDGGAVDGGAVDGGDAGAPDGAAGNGDAGGGGSGCACRAAAARRSPAYDAAAWLGVATAIVLARARRRRDQRGRLQ